MPLKPCHYVTIPQADVRKGKPRDTFDFAIHPKHIQAEPARDLEGQVLFLSAHFGRELRLSRLKPPKYMEG
ncbi:MAG: hypothetical protein K1Y36_08755 [Blastocatellia bacterium]|nr:hypothetical protein [Blastocatellia bacterium]